MRWIAVGLILVDGNGMPAHVDWLVAAVGTPYPV